MEIGTSNILFYINKTYIFVFLKTQIFETFKIGSHIWRPIEFKIAFLYYVIFDIKAMGHLKY